MSVLNADFDPRSNLTAAGANPEQYDLQKAVSKAQSIRELREIQEVALSRIRSPKATDKSISILSSTYLDAREQIRIEKGIIKPGSRNVSVRELSATEQQKRIGPRASRPTDYLKDAEATLARAQAMSEPTPPPDSQAK